MSNRLEGPEELPLIERGMKFLEKLPRWAVPPVVGAATLFALTAVRTVFVVTASPIDARALAMLAALLVSSVAGAAVGLVYVVVRPALRKLKLVGDLLTGAILGWAYLFAILLPAQFILHDEMITTTRGWMFASLYSAGLGLACGVLYWYYLGRKA